MASNWYVFKDANDELAAVNLDEAGALVQRGDDVCVQWGGMDSECTLIPNMTVAEVVRYGV